MNSVNSRRVRRFRRADARSDAAAASALGGRTVLALLIVDVVGLAVAALLGFELWAVLATGALAAVPSAVGLPLAVLPFGFFLAGLYPAAGMGPVEEMRRLWLVPSVVFGVTLLAFGVLGAADRAALLALTVGWLLALVALPLGRGVLRALVSRRRWWGVPAVVLGAGRTAELLLERLESHPEIGIKAIACFDDDPDKTGQSLRGVPVLGPLAGAEEFGREQRVQRALVAMPGIAPANLIRLVREHAGAFPYLVVVPNLFGMASVSTDTRDLGGVIGLHARQNLLIPSNRVAKRLLDLALLVPALLVGLPLIALGALLVMLVDRGNPFYAQLREGEGGRKIAVLKLRTMRKDADRYLHRYLERNSEAKREWGTHYKLSHDPRILPGVGGFLRRSSIDELPQLLNILRGEMSFVGPRPFPYYHLDSFGGEFRKLRASVPPGLTGMWQVTSRSTADLDVQERLDSYYIRNWSPWMDLYLLARTPFAVVFGKGAY